MKSLVKKLANTDLGILLRNSLNLNLFIINIMKKNFLEVLVMLFYGEQIMDIRLNLNFQIF